MRVHGHSIVFGFFLSPRNVLQSNVVERLKRLDISRMEALAEEAPAVEAKARVGCRGGGLGTKEVHCSLLGRQLE